MKKTISVRFHVDDEDIKNLLYSAQVGSNYWCSNELGYESAVKEALYGKGSKMYDHEGEKNHILTKAKIKKGLTVMAKKESSHFVDLIQGNTDDSTADVFLQCCLFGEVLYS